MCIIFDFWSSAWRISGRVPGTCYSKSTGAYAPVAPILTEALSVDDWNHFEAVCFFLDRNFKCTKNDLANNVLKEGLLLGGPKRDGMP